MNDIVARRRFWQGFLLSLGEKRNKLSVVSMEKLHSAFGSMIELAVKTKPEIQFEFLSKIRIDPMFGRFYEVEEMIIEGEDSLLIECGRIHMYFRCNQDEAKRSLESSRYPQREWFRSLANEFLEKFERYSQMETGGKR